MTSIEKAKRAGKPYTLKSSAVRAAKEDGFKPGEFEVKKNKKGFYYEPNEDLVQEAVLDELERDLAYVANHETFKGEVPQSASPDLLQEMEDRAERADSGNKTIVKAPPPPPPPPAVAQAVAQETPTGDDETRSEAAAFRNRRLSKCDSPTKIVWQLCDEMTAANPDVKRKEIMARCNEYGIAYNTAATQIQWWRKAKGLAKSNAKK